MFYTDLNESEKRAARGLIVTFVVFATLFVAALAVSYSVAAWQSWKGIERESKLQVSVTGEGKVAAKPDVVRISASVLTTAPALADAESENAAKSQKIVAYLKSAGVSEADIKTTSFAIQPQYATPSPCRSFPCPVDTRLNIVGYEVRNSLEVTIRDIGKASGILGGVVDAGANDVGGLNFTFDKPDELRAAARAQAIADARAKAERLARDLGKRLGRIVSFSEGGSTPPPVFFGREAAIASGVPAPAIQPGENEVRASVSITYEFK